MYTYHFNRKVITILQNRFKNDLSNMELCYNMFSRRKLTMNVLKYEGLNEITILKYIPTHIT